MQTVYVLLYPNNEWRSLECSANESAELICRKLCQQQHITPSICTLFALRVFETDDYLPCNAEVRAGAKYEFRLRFQVHDLLMLKKAGQVAYDYFYFQVKCDLLASKIPGLEYPIEKDRVAGLCVTNMFIEMKEKDLGYSNVMSNYQKYVPEKYVKKHSLFIKSRLSGSLKQLMGQEAPNLFVAKNSILESVRSMAPNYLVERCPAYGAYLPEDDISADEKCAVELEFSPHHPEQPGLRVYYQYKKRWLFIGRINDIYTIVVEGQSVQFAIHDKPQVVSFTVPNANQLQSFVSCVCGYYRLMVKWTVELCRSVRSPHLETLMRDKCHGPISGDNAYHKLQKNKQIGAFVLRECERSFDTYYIDIVSTDNQPETFKCTKTHNAWQLDTNRTHTYSNLLDVARAIHPEITNKQRIAPSTSDNFSTLLLCLPPNKLMVRKTLSEDLELELRSKNAQILNPKTDLWVYKNTAKFTDNSIIKEMKADWILPDNKRLEVTLKMLENQEYMKEFMMVAEKWSKLFAPELVKMYGFMVFSPPSLVIESIRLGPLDTFLQDKNSVEEVPVSCLIDAAYSLARALLYLHTQEIAHGRIRASKLQVVKFESGSHLVVRLGDPGFHRGFSLEDIPWIPDDYVNRLNGTVSGPDNYTADFCAFATTLWEIFARGRKPMTRGEPVFGRFVHPIECPLDIYNIMMEGWGLRPDQSFDMQYTLERLICARESCRPSYASIGVSSSRVSIPNSIVSSQTENTTVSNGGPDNHSLYSGHSSNSGNTATEDTITTTYGISTSNASSMLRDELSHDDDGDDNNDDGSYEPNAGCCIDYLTSVFELSDGGRLVLQGVIGKGNYGTVYRAELQYENSATTVACKQFNQVDAKRVDFDREVKIMRNLNHPNIVKIINCMEHPPSIIMELETGSLINYLRQHDLNAKLLLDFAKEIATGMQYLVSKKIVHRDLAARNVLYDDEKRLKISDFGLAQNTENGYYYVRNRQREVPLPWYAPEVISTQRYSHKSDVWSFGILMFEMFSKGQSPDLRPGHISGRDMLDILEKGIRLPRPALCPESVYESLMLSCWRWDPRARPDFTEILVLIDQCMSEMGESI